jgi:hypothetical protein
VLDSTARIIQAIRRLQLAQVEHPWANFRFFRGG